MQLLDVLRLTVNQVPQGKHCRFDSYSAHYTPMAQQACAESLKLSTFGVSVRIRLGVLKGAKMKRFLQILFLIIALIISILVGWPCLLSFLILCNLDKKPSIWLITLCAGYSNFLYWTLLVKALI